MLCPVCSSNEAQKHPTLGVLPCLDCKVRRDTQKSPDHPVEFTSSEIKASRREFAKDIIQPRKGDEPSKEFIEAYPKRAKAMFTEREIKKAVNVWK